MHPAKQDIFERSKNTPTLCDADADVDDALFDFESKLTQIIFYALDITGTLWQRIEKKIYSEKTLCNAKSSAMMSFVCVCNCVCMCLWYGNLIYDPHPLYPIRLNAKLLSINHFIFGGKFPSEFFSWFHHHHELDARMSFRKNCCYSLKPQHFPYKLFFVLFISNFRFTLFLLGLFVLINSGPVNRP